MYNLKKQLWYWHSLTRHCPCNLLLNMNIERNFEATLWRHRWRHHHEKLFWHDMGRSFHIWGPIEAVFDISKFSKWPPFWSCDKLFLPKVIPEVEYTRKIAMNISNPTFWAFDRSSNPNIDGDISISKFDLLYDLVTSSMPSWTYIYILVVIISWYLCTGSLMMIPLLVFLVIMKNVVISFIKEYRGPTLGPPCDVIEDVIIMKIPFFGIIGDDLFICEVK